LAGALAPRPETTQRQVILNQRPFFIFGCPRSGTSVLTRMLGTHPNLAIPYESHLYNRFYPLVRRYGVPAVPASRERLVRHILDSDYIRDWSPVPSVGETLAGIRRPDFHGIVESILQTWARSQGKRRWGEKTPQHTLCWRSILEGFPELQIIHLVRDGRDVAVSYMAAHFGPKHAYQLGHRWVTYLNAAEEARAGAPDDGFLTVRYEDLIAAPEDELRRICAFLGEEFAPGMLTYYRQDVAYPTDRHNEDNLRRPVLRNNTGKWRSAMSTRELRIFEAIAGRELERYGYPRVVPDARLYALESLSCRFLEHPPRRAVAMLRNSQGRRLALETVRLNLRMALSRWAGSPN
jgi:hypothetical protein